jgi:hypothetical protein
MQVHTPNRSATGISSAHRLCPHSEQRTSIAPESRRLRAGFCTLRAIFRPGARRRVDLGAMCGKKLASRCLLLLSLSPNGFTPERAPGSLLRGPSDREVIETMTHRGLDQRNSASGEVYDKPHAALYALLAGPRDADRRREARGSPRTTSSPTSCAGCRRRSSKKPRGFSMCGRPNDTGKRRCQEAALDFVGPRGGGHPHGPLAGIDRYSPEPVARTFWHFVSTIAHGSIADRPTGWAIRPGPHAK